MYYPDKWILLKVTHPELGATYKVLASWYGGFAGSDSWKLSSGTTKVEIDGDQFLLEQYTGSTYVISKHNWGTSMYTAGILNSWLNRLAETPEQGTIEVMDQNFDLASML
jgi:hypothetical protein